MAHPLFDEIYEVRDSWSDNVVHFSLSNQLLALWEGSPAAVLFQPAARKAVALQSARRDRSSLEAEADGCRPAALRLAVLA